MSRLRPRLLAVPFLALVLLAGACSSDSPPVVVSGNDPTTGAKDIVETLDAEGFTVLVALLGEADLVEALTDGDGDETYTLLAPTDAAFGALAPGLAEILSGEDDVIAAPPEDDEADGDGQAEGDGDTAEEAEEDDAPTTPTTLAPRPSRAQIRDLLADILQHHVVEDGMLADELLDAGRVTSLEGSSLEFDTREEPPATEGGDPTEVPTVNGVDISGTDLRATNGVIHTIDEVLVPEDRVEELEQLIASIPVMTDAMTTLRNTGEHTELVAALEGAGLDDDLADAGAVTVFAPTDEAFASLSAGQQAALQDPQILADVLGFHVVGRTITTDDVANRESVATRQGESVLLVKVIERPEEEETEEGEEPPPAEPPTITYTVDDILIEDSIPATNGVVHVIGEVLVPDAASGPGGL